MTHPDTDAQQDVPTIAFDYGDPAWIADPYPFWERMRKCPVSYSDDYGGVHLVGRFDAVSRIATDPGTFSSALGTAVPDPGDFSTLLPIEADPPQHCEYRKVLNPAFSPQAIRRYEPVLRGIAQDLLAGFDAGRKVDLVTEYVGPLPRLFTLDMLGLPRADEPMLTHWVEVQAGTEPDPEGTALVQFAEYAAAVALERKAHPDEYDDLISVVVKGTVDGRPMTDDENRRTVMLLIVGGLHTTTSALAGAFHWLAQHPDEYTRLRTGGQGHLNTAIDEFLRHTSPNTYIGRKIGTDVVVGGCPVPAGSQVVMSYAAANHDPAQFPDPLTLDLDRQPNRHLAFGIGPHRCVGSHLARLMMRVAFEEFGARVAAFELDPATGPTWVGGMARGIVRLPAVVTDPAA